MASSSTRTPGLLVLVGGVPLAGVYEADVTTTSHLAAGRFSLKASFTAAGPALLSAGAVNAEVRFGLDGAWLSAITGTLDRIEIDPVADEIVCDGRDLSARFIGQGSQETFENRTSSDIATTLALRQGLIPSVTATTTPVGRYYQSGHSRSTLHLHARAMTEWDLLVWLADIEGFDVWVDGSTLNFMPQTATVSVTLGLTAADCMKVRLEKRLDVTASSILVQSWNSATGGVVTASSTASSSGSATPSVLVRPNLTQVEAQALATQVASRLLAQGRRIWIDMPGDLITLPRTTLAFAGTGTEFDTTYRVTEVERRVSVHDGYQQTLIGQEVAWTTS